MLKQERQEKVLTGLLEAGYRDLDRLDEILAIAEWIGLDTRDIIEECKQLGDININTVMYVAMRSILIQIAEHTEKEEIKERIENHEVFTNYMDSWFNVEYLDSLEADDLPSKSTIIQETLKEFERGYVEEHELDV